MAPGPKSLYFRPGRCKGQLMPITNQEGTKTTYARPVRTLS